jgi:hypothetical protein
MTGKDGTDYLMVVYEGVENECTSTYLLSEFQIRHNGVIVDSTSNQHLGIYGNPGTQSINPLKKELLFHYMHVKVWTHWMILAAMKGYPQSSGVTIQNCNDMAKDGVQD